MVLPAVATVGGVAAWQLANGCCWLLALPCIARMSSFAQQLTQSFTSMSPVQPEFSNESVVFQRGCKTVCTVIQAYLWCEWYQKSLFTGQDNTKKVHMRIFYVVLIRILFSAGTAIMCTTYSLALQLCRLVREVWLLRSLCLIHIQTCWMQVQPNSSCGGHYVLLNLRWSRWVTNLHGGPCGCHVVLLGFGIMLARHISLEA